MWLTSVLGLTSCLISPPEPLTELERVPPRVLMQDAYPFVFKTTTTSSTGVVPEFRVPFWSEEFEGDIIGGLYLNYDEANERHIGSASVGAGSLSDPEPREMVVYWQKDLNRPPGCYTITMVITHADNLTRDVVPKPIDSDLAAFVPWVTAHDIDRHDVTLDDCPPLAIPEGSQESF